MTSWYVLHVKTGNEHDVVDWMKKFIPNSRALVPQRILKERCNGIWKTVTLDVFPSYVFIKVDMTVDIYYKLKGIPHLIRILGDDKTPQSVPEEEMKVVFQFCWNDNPLGISDIVLEGSEIKVISGPLEGFNGKIIKVEPRRFRAKVSISLMGQERIVELGINVVKKIG